MCSEEPARSVSGAEALISKHSEHKHEIDAREDSVVQVTKVGRKLIQQSHYASAEVIRPIRLALSSPLGSCRSDYCISKTSQGCG